MEQDQHAGEVDGARATRILLILILSAITYSLAQTMVLPALPQIQEDTGTSASGVTWLITGFLLVSCVATPVLGRLGDMFGKERMLLAAMIGFAIGSLICALGTGSLALLIVGRAVQGLAAAVFPLSFGIIRDEFPREKVARSIGTISSVFGVGGGVGLVLAGLFVDHVSVSAVFWLSVAMTVISAWAIWKFVPESPVRAPAKVDWGGGALMTIGLAAVLLGISQGPSWGWTSGGVLALIVGGLLVCAAFVAYERRVPEPLVDMTMLARRAIWSPNLAAFAIGFAMFGSFILIPKFVEAPESTGYGFDLSATGAGLILFPSAIVMLIFGPISGALSGRFGPRLPLAIGAAFAAAAFAALALWHDALWTIVFGSTLLGIGIALAFAAMATLIVQSVDQSQTGVATGVNTIMRNVGGAVGGQVSASLLASQVLDGGFPAESGYTSAFVLSGVAALVALAACGLIPASGRRGARRAPSQATA